jgi:hypothetical protein
VLVLAALCAIAAPATGAAQAASSRHVTLQMSGEPAGLLYPGGPAQGIPLSLENPMNETIYITRVSAAVRDTGATGCDSGWFQTTSLNLANGGVPVPPKASVTLGQAGRGEPTIRMRESGTDQNACRDAKLTLTYTGKVHPAAAKQATSPSGSGGGGGDLPFTGLPLLPLVIAGAILGLAGLLVRSRPDWARR